MLSQSHKRQVSRIGSSSHVNYRYLTDQEKNARLSEQRHEIQKARRKLAHLSERIAELTKIIGTNLDNASHDDMKTTMK